MTYYPTMAYHMASLEPAVRPPDALSGLTDLLNSFTSGAAKLFGAADTAVATTLAVGQSGGAWCSTLNPQSGCTIIPGVCLPMTATALEHFKELQRQANRVLVKLGKSAITVDGRIGAGTVNAVATCLQAAAPSDASAQGGGKACDLIANRATAIAGLLRSYADTTGAPTVPDPATSQPSVAAANGTVVHPPKDVIVNSADTMGGLFNWIPAEIKTPLGLVALAVGGYAAWQAWRGPGKGRGRRGARRSSGRRRGR